MTTFTCQTHPTLVVYGEPESAAFRDGFLVTDDAELIAKIRSIAGGYGISEVGYGDTVTVRVDTTEFVGLNADGLLSWVLQPAGLSVDDLDRDLTDAEKARALAHRPAIVTRATAVRDYEVAKVRLDRDDDLVETLAALIDELGDDVTPDPVPEAPPGPITYPASPGDALSVPVVPVADPVVAPSAEPVSTSDAVPAAVPADVTPEPVADEPVVEPVADEPVVEPVADEPVVGPVADEPVVTPDPVADEPPAEAPKPRQRRRSTPSA